MSGLFYRKRPLGNTTLPFTAIYSHSIPLSSLLALRVLMLRILLARLDAAPLHSKATKDREAS